MKIKRSSCRHCGGGRVTPPRTAYVYCDYCATLIDYDFQLACRTPGSARPGPAYEALYAELRGPLNQARATRDVPAFAALQRRLLSAHLEACPAAYSPRIGDPAYREALLDYLVACQVAGECDERTHALAVALGQATQALVFVQTEAGLKVTDASFWAMYQASEAFQANWNEACAREGALAKDPDQRSRELQERMGRSLFAQGWLPYLGGAATERLLQVAGLRGDYVEAWLPTQERACGRCGAGLHLAEGAKRVVCEACGHLLAGDRPEFPCPGCGVRLQPPDRAAGFGCPHCQTQLTWERPLDADA